MHIAHFTFDCCIWPHKKHRTQSHAYKCITFDFMLHFTRMKLSRHHRQTRYLHYITCTQFANTENIEWIFAYVCVCVCAVACIVHAYILYGQKFTVSILAQSLCTTLDPTINLYACQYGLIVVNRRTHKHTIYG